MLPATCICYRPMLLVVMHTNDCVHLLTALADLQEVSVAKSKRWRRRTAAASMAFIKSVGKRSKAFVLGCCGQQSGVLVGLMLVQSLAF